MIRPAMTKRVRIIRSSSAALGTWLCLLPAAVAAQASTWIVVPAESSVQIVVGKSGLFSLAGHTHEVIAPALSGDVQFEPQRLDQASISLIFDATSLKVTGKGEPAGDVPEVQETMLGARVLDVANHPQITFRSQKIVIQNRSADRIRLQVSGELTLRGVTRPIAGTTDVQLGSDRLSATGTMLVKQTAFGIEPVTAGLGTVRVKDEVTISYTIVARR